MAEVVADALLQALKSFIAEDITIDELRRSLSQQFFAESAELPMDREVIGEIEIALAQFDLQHATEAELRGVASDLLATIVQRSPLKVTFTPLPSRDEPYTVTVRTQTSPRTSPALIESLTA